MPEGRTQPLTSRVAIVTGASSGIGRAIAAELAARGMSVVITSRSEERAQAAAAGSEGAVGSPAELTEEGAPEALVERVLSDHGRLDVLVNNAGSGQLGGS